MISFLRLGTYGRLANQMFQYATLKAVGIRRDYEVRIPRPSDLDLLAVFDIPEPELTPHDAQALVHTYTEPHFAFSDAVFDVPDNSNLHGYFQSQRYFMHCETQIREAFSFRRPRGGQSRCSSAATLQGMARGDAW